MSWVHGLKARLRPWLRRARAERELEEELAFHLECETAKNLAAGLPPAEAARAARLSFGGADRFREEVRDAWAGAFRGLGGDLRLGLRRLRRRPGFAMVAVATLALGIGANTAVFSLVKSVLLRPLPYAEPDRLVLFWGRAADQAQDLWLSQREVLEYRRATSTFAQIAAYTTANTTLAEGEPERVRTGLVTANLFSTLGVPPLHGRAFTDEEDLPGRDRVAVLGHGLWQRQFGGAPDVIGRDVRVSGEVRRVVGVMPPHFRLPLDYLEDRPTELWLPAAIDPAADLPWGDRSYYIVGRLRAGTAAAAATADMEAAVEAWRRQGFLQSGEDGSGRVALPLDHLLLRRVRPALLILFGAVGLLLLIACANVAHLLLARGDARRREIATQAALGASGLRIARQLLVESALLGLLGAAAGMALAQGALRAALALTPVNVIRMKGVALDAGVLVFTAAVALAATLAAGLFPALRLSRAEASGALAGARGEGAPVRRGARRLLVAGQTALSVVLVLCAALLARSFHELRRVDLGFEVRDALTFRVELPGADYPDGARIVRTQRELVDRVAALPGVRAAGGVRVLPLTRTIGDWSITVEHRPARAGENPNADWQIVTAGYMEAMGLQVRRGRPLSRADDENAPLVAVVNETMAGRYWPGRDAIGRRFHLGTREQPWIEVVGIARDVRHNAVIEDARAEMYLPHAQFGRARGDGRAEHRMVVVALTGGDPRRLLPLVREQVRALDPRLPLSEVKTLKEVVADALAESRFTTLLLGTFAALALALAGIGLFGVVSFVTARRTREIGVRVALGARPREIRALVVRDGLGMTLAGVAAGLLASVWAVRLVSGQLYRVAALDPLAFAAAPAVLLAVAVVASLAPAWRAARVNPVVALRQD